MEQSTIQHHSCSDAMHMEEMEQLEADHPPSQIPEGLIGGFSYQELVDVNHNQATLNVGVIGHVNHGKSTLVKALTGVSTGKFYEEVKQGITIHVGNANAKIWRCKACPYPDCYFSTGSQIEYNVRCLKCNSEGKLVRQISFVDCPGHDEYFQRMASGGYVVDVAILMVAADIECPQPSTRSHLVAMRLKGLQKLLVVQNKIDIALKLKGQVEENYNQITEFLKETPWSNSPILPVCAIQKLGLDALLYELVKIPIPSRKYQGFPLMNIIRSYDVNRPGKYVLHGGVVGGSIKQGVLEVGMPVIILPGVITKHQDGKRTYKPVRTKIVSLKAETKELKYALPGGLIGVELDIDPILTKRDLLVGNFLGVEGHLPPCLKEIKIRYELMRRFITDENTNQKISPIYKSEILQIQIGAAHSLGRVKEVGEGLMTIRLKTPICSDMGAKVSLGRFYYGRYKLIGWGDLLEGENAKESSER